MGSDLHGSWPEPPRRLAPRRNNVALCYHGLDLERFPPAPPGSSGSDGSDPEHPVMLLSVGRLVVKKGYEDLLTALALLPPDLEWRFVHIGGGALRKALLHQAARLGLSHKIEWRGTSAQPDVLASYRQADLFVLASKVAKDGDRDGLPNVLIEAQSQRLACVATDVSGIPELIANEVTGLLVPPDDPVGLSQAISALIRDPARRAAMGAAGERRVHNNFAIKSGIDVLAMRFGLLRANRQAISLDDASQPRHDAHRAGEYAVLQVSGFLSRGVLAPQQSGK